MCAVSTLLGGWSIDPFGNSTPCVGQQHCVQRAVKAVGAVLLTLPSVTPHALEGEGDSDIGSSHRPGKPNENENEKIGLCKYLLSSFSFFFFEREIVKRYVYVCEFGV